MHGPGIFISETVLRSGGNVKRGRSARRLVAAGRRPRHGFAERLVALKRELWLTPLRMASSTCSTNRRIPPADLHILAPLVSGAHRRSLSVPPEGQAE
jgi:hypothetical protein